MEAQYFWESSDSSEQVVIGNGEILFVDKSGKSIALGTTVAEARKKLVDLGKDEDFYEFMADYTL